MEIILQKQAPIKTVEGHNEDGKVTWLLEYYLQTYPNPSNDGKGRFGIKIIRNNPDGTHDKTAETFAITDDFDEAMAMVKHFSKKAIRPHILCDMVEEWFADRALRKGDASSPQLLPAWHTYHAG